MRGNRAKNTKPELLVRRLLRRVGYGGYRLHWKVPGRPDIAYPGRRVAIFVNGCYWHRCPQCDPPLPKAHRDFWEEKFARNIQRDARKTRDLEDLGWRVITVWECQLRDDPTRVLRNLVQALSRPVRG